MARCLPLSCFHSSGESPLTHAETSPAPTWSVSSATAAAATPPCAMPLPRCRMACALACAQVGGGCCAARRGATGIAAAARAARLKAGAAGIAAAGRAARLEAGAAGIAAAGRAARLEAGAGCAPMLAATPLPLGAAFHPGLPSRPSIPGLQSHLKPESEVPPAPAALPQFVNDLEIDLLPPYHPSGALTSWPAGVRVALPEMLARPHQACRLGVWVPKGSCHRLAAACG